MSLILRDRVKQTTTTTGTGNVTLSGTPANFQSFDGVLSTNDVVYYTIESDAGWEVGEGTYQGSNVLSRDTIHDSSNGGSAVSLTGTSTVFITYPAQKAIFDDENDRLNLTGDETVTSPDGRVEISSTDNSIIPLVVSSRSSNRNGDVLRVIPKQTDGRYISVDSNNTLVWNTSGNYKFGLRIPDNPLTTETYWWPANPVSESGQALCTNANNEMYWGGPFVPTGDGVVGAGAGAANRVAFWSDATTLTSDANFLFDGSQLSAPQVRANSFLRLGDGAIARAWDYYSITGVESGAPYDKSLTFNDIDTSGSASSWDRWMFRIGLMNRSSTNFTASHYLARRNAANTSWEIIQIAQGSNATSDDLPLLFVQDDALKVYTPDSAGTHEVIVNMEGYYVNRNDADWQYLGNDNFWNNKRLGSTHYLTTQNELSRIGLLKSTPVEVLDAAAKVRFDSSYGTLDGPQIAATSITFNCDTANLHTYQLEHATTTLALSNYDKGQRILIRLEQDSSGNRDVNWWSNIYWPDGGTEPSLCKVADHIDVFGFLVTSTVADGGVDAFDGFCLGTGLTI